MMTNPCREFIQVFKTHFQFCVQPLVAEISMIKDKTIHFKVYKKKIKAG